MSDTTGKDFFNAPCPTEEGRTRRENIADVVGHMREFLDLLLVGVKVDSIAGARSAFDEIKGWVGVLDDDLCERDADGCRIEKDPE